MVRGEKKDSIIHLMFIFDRAHLCKKIKRILECEKKKVFQLKLMSNCCYTIHTYTSNVSVKNRYKHIPWHIVLYIKYNISNGLQSIEPK